MLHTQALFVHMPVEQVLFDVHCTQRPTFRSRRGAKGRGSAAVVVGRARTARVRSRIADGRRPRAIGVRRARELTRSEMELPNTRLRGCEV